MRSHAAAVLTSAPIRTPSPYLVADEVLGAQDLEALLRYWPERTLFAEDDPGSGYLLLRFERSDLWPKLTPEQSAFWRGFIDGPLQQIVQACFAQFAPAIEARFGEALASVDLATFALTEFVGDHVRAGVHAHNDEATWLYTILMHVEDGGSSDRGNALYGFPGQDGRNDLDSMLARIQQTPPGRGPAEMVPLAQVPFAPGRLFAFLETPLAYHGNEPVPPGPVRGSRRMMRAHVRAPLELAETLYGVDADSFRRLRCALDGNDRTRAWMKRDIESCRALPDLGATPASLAYTRRIDFHGIHGKTLSLAAPAQAAEKARRAEARKQKEMKAKMSAEAAPLAEQDPAAKAKKRAKEERAKKPKRAAEGAPKAERRKSKFAKTAVGRWAGRRLVPLLSPLAAQLGYEVVPRKRMDRLRDCASLVSGGSVQQEGYGVATEGPVPPDSDLHRLYLLQTYPDPLITGPGRRLKLFRRLFDDDKRYPWYDPIRIVQFMWLTDIANRLPDGDYAEVGTAGGHGARYIWKLMDAERSLYCFDTFEGFTAEEVAIENERYGRNIPVDFIGENPVDAVRGRILRGEPGDRLHLVKGWFPGSFEGYEALRFRFVHVDLDLYEPTRATLETLWPRLLPGGVMLFHDYGCALFPGVRQAVDEFFEPLGITPMPLYDKLVSAAVIKPKGG